MHMIDNLGGKLGSFDRLEKEPRARRRLDGLRPRRRRQRVLRAAEGRARARRARAPSRLGAAPGGQPRGPFVPMQVWCCVASRSPCCCCRSPCPRRALAHGGAVTHADTPARAGRRQHRPRAEHGRRVGHRPADVVVRDPAARPTTSRDAAQPPSAAVVKVVYAYAPTAPTAPRPGRPRCRATCRPSTASWPSSPPAAAPSASTWARRAARSTSTSPSCALPQPRAAYLGETGFDTLRDDVLARARPRRPARATC